MRLRSVLSIIAVLSLSFPGRAQPKHRYSFDTVSNGVVIEERGLTPLWSGGAFLAVVQQDSDEPIIERIDRRGSRERVRLSIPNGRNIWVMGVAGRPDGALAALAVVYDDYGKGVVALVRIAPDRKQQTVVRQWPYIPKVLTFDAEGNIWTVGWIRDETRILTSSVVKRFDPTGTETLSFVTTALSDSNPGGNAISLSRLTSTKDRIAWLSNGNEYIEFHLNGRERLRLPGPALEAGPAKLSLAVSEDGEVLVSNMRKGVCKIWRLDRAALRWIPVELDTPLPLRWAYVLGFDGEDLMLAEGSQSLSLIRYRRTAVN